MGGNKMVIVELCVGSACYVKGSNQIISMVKQMLVDNNWEEKVDIKGAFCMGMCTQGIGVKVNGKAIEGLGLHNAKQLIEQRIKEEL